MNQPFVPIRHQGSPSRGRDFILEDPTGAAFALWQDTANREPA